MPRITFLLCSGLCLISAASLNAQKFPKNPTLQQMVGYQLKQVQHWQMEQLPANSVLYQFKTPIPKIKSNQNSDFEPFIIFPAQPQLPVAEMQISDFNPSHFTNNQTYTQWLKQNRWHLIKKSLGN